MVVLSASPRRRRGRLFAAGLAIAVATLTAACSSSNQSGTQQSTQSQQSSQGQQSTAVSTSDQQSSGATSGSTTSDQTSGTTGSTASTADSALHDLLPARIKQQGYVTIVSDTSFGPPWVYNPEDAPDTFAGIDPDLATELFENKLGVQVRHVQNPFDGIIPALKAGRYDLVMNGMTDKADREQQIDMIHYVDDSETIVVAKGNPKSIHGLEDLCGKNVAVVTGTHEADIAQDQSTKCSDKINISLFPATTAVYLAIKSGRADATINGYAAAMYQMNNSVEGFDGLEALPDVRIGANPLGIGVPKSDPDLSKAIVAGLNAMIADGSYLKILTKWNVEGGALKEAVLNAQSK